MLFFDIIFLGIYTLLNKSYNLHSVSKSGFGPKEHSFYISIAIHTMNIDSLCSYLTITYLHRDVGIYMSILILVLVILIGYLIYYKGGRADKIINEPLSSPVTIIYIFISLVYIAVSAYLMIITGNHNRELLTGESANSNMIKIAGVYVATPNINTFDTLKLNNQGEYIHSIYRKDSSLVYSNVGKWEISTQRLKLSDFMLNKDAVYNTDTKDFKSELFSFSFPYKIISDNITIQFGDEPYDYYYQNVK